MNKLINYLILITGMVVVFGLQAEALCTGCTYTFAGTGSSYNLNGNETLCISSGTFTGSVNFSGSNNRVCIAAGAIFSPGTLNNVNGVAFANQGTFNVNQSFSFGAGTSITNFAVLNQNSNFNFNGAVTLVNESNAQWTVQQNFILQNGSSFTNNGRFDTRNEFSTQSGTTFTNNGRTQVGRNFNPSGTVNNRGFLYARQFININSNAVVRNFCTFYSEEGFNNNSGNTQNFGLIWVRSNNAQVQINAPYFQGPGALTRGERFTNSSSVTGAGSYYFTKNTVNQGPFGQDGQGINFYDVSGSPNRIFDVQNTNPHPSVIALPFVPDDTTNVYPGCASQFATPVALDSVVIISINESLTIPLASIALDTVSSIDLGLTDLNPNVAGIDSIYVDPGKGTFVLTPGGNIVFIPVSDFTGKALLQFTVINQLGFRSNIGIVGVIVENSSPLPVELLYFSAERDGGKAVLSWATASEFNSDYFEVLRSADGIDFHSIGRVEAAGYSAATIEYQLADLQPLPGENYYRLKQVDFDGTTELFRIVSVTFDQAEAMESLKLFPNPAAALLNVTFTSETRQVNLYDLNGKLLQTLIAAPDQRQTQLDVSGLQPGMFAVEMIDLQGRRSFSRFIKQ